MVKARDVNLPNSFPVKGHTFALARSSYLAQLAIVVALAGCSCGEVGSTRLTTLGQDAIPHASNRPLLYVANLGVLNSFVTIFPLGQSQPIRKLLKASKIQLISHLTARETSTSEMRVPSRYINLGAKLRSGRSHPALVYAGTWRSTQTATCTSRTLLAHPRRFPFIRLEHRTQTALLLAGSRNRYP